jgi:hypothetical protein
MKNQPKQPGTKPTHRIYNVTGTGKNSGWAPIGAMWMHKDGSGFSITLDAAPVYGRCVARLITERPQAAA